MSTYECVRMFVFSVMIYRTIFRPLTKDFFSNSKASSPPFYHQPHQSSTPATPTTTTSFPFPPASATGYSSLANPSYPYSHPSHEQQQGPLHTLSNLQHAHHLGQPSSSSLASAQLSPPPSAGSISSVASSSSSSASGSTAQEFNSALKDLFGGSGSGSPEAAWYHSKPPPPYQEPHAPPQAHSQQVQSSIPSRVANQAPGPGSEEQERWRKLHQEAFRLHQDRLAGTHQQQLQQQQLQQQQQPELLEFRQVKVRDLPKLEEQELYVTKTVLKAPTATVTSPTEKPASSFGTLYSTGTTHQNTNFNQSHSLKRPHAGADTVVPRKTKTVDSSAPPALQDNQQYPLQQLSQEQHQMNDPAIRKPHPIHPTPKENSSKPFAHMGLMQQHGIPSAAPPPLQVPAPAYPSPNFPQQPGGYYPPPPPPGQATWPPVQYGQAFPTAPHSYPYLYPHGGQLHGYGRYNHSVYYMYCEYCRHPCGGKPESYWAHLCEKHHDKLEEMAWVEKHQGDLSQTTLLKRHGPRPSMAKPKDIPGEDRSSLQQQQESQHHQPYSTQLDPKVAEDFRKNKKCMCDHCVKPLVSGGGGGKKAEHPKKTSSSGAPKGGRRPREKKQGMEKENLTPEQLRRLEESEWVNRTGYRCKRCADARFETEQALIDHMVEGRHMEGGTGAGQ